MRVEESDEIVNGNGYLRVEAKDEAVLCVEETIGISYELCMENKQTLNREG